MTQDSPRDGQAIQDWTLDKSLESPCYYYDLEPATIFTTTINYPRLSRQTFLRKSLVHQGALQTFKL